MTFTNNLVSKFSVKRINIMLIKILSSDAIFIRMLDKVLIDWSSTSMNQNLITKICNIVASKGTALIILKNYQVLTLPASSDWFVQFQ